MKEFDVWTKHKKQIDTKLPIDYAKEREIWWCSLGLNIGDEQDGKNELFERPVLILKKFNQHIVLIVPMSSRLKVGRYYFTITQGTVSSSVILSQLRLISTKRLTRRIRKIGGKTFKCIVDRIKKVCF